jgi:hypothetical protein
MRQSVARASERFSVYVRPMPTLAPVVWRHAVEAAKGKHAHVGRQLVRHAALEPPCNQPCASCIGRAVGQCLAGLDGVVGRTEATVADQQAGAQAVAPARAGAVLQAKLRLQAQAPVPAQVARLEHAAQRQLEADALRGVSAVEEPAPHRPELHQRAQPRHALARPQRLAARTQRARERHVQLETVRTNRAQSGTVVVGPQHLAAVDEIGQDRRAGDLLVGTGVGLLRESASGHAHLPQRQLRR